MTTPEVAVVAVGQSKHGKRQEVTWVELVNEAAKEALGNTDLTASDIDAFVCGSMPALMEGTNDPHHWWVDGLGAQSKPIMRIATCGSTGISTAISAYFHVASGLFDIVMALGTEKMYEGSPQGTMNALGEPQFVRPFFPGAVAGFAIQCMEYIHRYGKSVKEIAEYAALVSVKNHNDAMDNPKAHVRNQITTSDVQESRMVCFPIRLLDSCPVSDGACAIIFASKKMAGKIAKIPAWIKGVGYAGDEQLYGDHDLVEWNSAKTAISRAYKMAGIINPIKQLDVAELYNPFTYQELLWYELFKFCEKGQGPKLIKDGVVTRNGELPCDPSGGVLCTNPIGASGLIRVGEAAMQVMNQAGRHQIPDVETALAHAMGGLMQFNGVMILSSNK